MRAGRLRNLVTIEQPAFGARDEYNDPAKSWAAVGQVWASIDAVSTREAERSKRFSDTVSHKVTARYREDIKPTCRIVFGARIFNIDGVIDADGRRRELSIFCTEVIK